MPKIGFSPVPMTMNTGKLGPFDPQSTFIRSPDQLNSFLAPYGMQVPQNVGGNFLFPNADRGAAGGFEGRHPGIFGALQNMMIAGANTPEAQGPEGAGGGISRVLQGTMAVPEVKRAKALEQFMAPFQVGDMVSGLQSRQAVDSFYKQYGAYFGARGTAASMNAENGAQSAAARLTDAQARALNAQTEADKANSLQPKPIPGLGMLTAVPKSDGSGYNWVIDKSNVPPLVKSGGLFGGEGSLEERVLQAQMSPDPAIRAQGNQAAKLHMAFAGQTADATAAGRADGTPGNITPEARQHLETAKLYFDHNLQQAQEQLRQLTSLTPGKQLAAGFDTPAKLQMAKNQIQSQIDLMNKAQAGYVSRFTASNGAIGPDEYIQELRHPELAAVQGLATPMGGSPQPGGGPRNGPGLNNNPMLPPLPNLNSLQVPGFNAPLTGGRGH